MLSVVIATQESEHALLPTLAALVAGAVAGIVHEVIVADAGSRDATAAIADAAGCRLLTSAAGRGARLAAAAAVARAPWLLFLEAGAVPDDAWIEETGRFVKDCEVTEGADGRAAIFRSAPSGSRPALVEALALLRAALGARPTASRGLLIAKSHYHALGGHRDVADTERDLIRRLGRRRIVLLRTGLAAARRGERPGADRP